MVYFGRYFILFILVFLLGSSNLNIQDDNDKHSIGGFRAMGGVFVTPVFSEEEINHYNNNITTLLKNNGFNGNVFVARYGTVLYNGSLGYKDFKNKKSLNDSTVFQVASIGKTFTAAAVLLLEYNNQLEIDDPVISHIPEFPYDNVTIRHLLNHTAGLQNYMWMIEHKWQSKKMPTNEDMLNLFVKHDNPLNFRPGHRFSYSNTGYAFLALLVERVSGISFAKFIEKQIFKPLNMNSSFVKDLHNPREVENVAYGYRRFGNTYRHIPDNYLDGILGDKGIYSSAGDLYKWDQALYSNRLLPQDVLTKAFEYGRLNNDRTVNYGLGWRLQTFLDRKVVHHPGRWHGFRTSFKRFVDDNATIIVLNNTNKNISRLLEELQNIVFHNEIREYTAKKNTIIEESTPEKNSILSSRIKKWPIQP